MSDDPISLLMWFLVQNSVPILSFLFTLIIVKVVFGEYKRMLTFKHALANNPVPQGNSTSPLLKESNVPKNLEVTKKRKCSGCGSATKHRKECPNNPKNVGIIQKPQETPKEGKKEQSIMVSVDPSLALSNSKSDEKPSEAKVEGEGFLKRLMTKAEGTE